MQVKTKVNQEIYIEIQIKWKVTDTCIGQTLSNINDGHLNANHSIIFGYLPQKFVLWTMSTSVLIRVTRRF